jgi:hypothetical protein
MCLIISAMEGIYKFIFYYCLLREYGKGILQKGHKLHALVEYLQEQRAYALFD